jgi:hypothetical protein
LVCGSRHFGKLVCRPFRLFPTIFFIFERPAVEVGALMSIFRIPEDKDEDCMKKTLAFLNEQLGLTFKESDIDRVHRLVGLLKALSLLKALAFLSTCVK